MAHFFRAVPDWQVNSMTKAWLTAALVAATFSLSACVVVPPQRPVAVWAPMAPPPPRVEVIPPRPYPEYVWITGHWTWENDHHRWQEGRWVAPRPHEHWEPHRWEPGEGGRWQLRGGYWRHD